MSPGGQNRVSLDRNRVLSYAQARSQLFLGPLHCSPQVLERRQLGGSPLDSGTPLCREGRDHLVKTSCHGNFPFVSVRPQPL